MSWESILSDPGMRAIVALAFFFLFALAWGGIHNRRLAQRLLEALRPLLPSLGKRTRLTWRGSAGFAAEVENPKAPFRQLTLSTHLLPRETIPVLWLLFWLAGRRDVLHIAATLRTSPQAQLRWGARRCAEEEGWHLLDMPGSTTAAIRGGSVEGVSAALHRLIELPARLERLNIAPSESHLQAEVRIKGLDQESLAALFAGLADLCRAAQARPSATSRRRQSSALFREPAA